MAATLLLIVATASTPAPVPLSCPEHIVTTQELAAPAEGWRASKDRTLNVDGKLRGGVVGFSFGPPERMGILKPYNVVTTKASLLSTWVLNQSEQVWVICRYSQTTIELSKQLPAGLKKCFIQQNRVDGSRNAWCE